MNLNALKDIYYRSPGFIINLIALIPFNIRYGKGFRKYSKFFAQYQGDYDQVSALKETIKFAYENIPYYKREWDKIGFSPIDFKTIHDLQKIPFIDKDIVKNNFDDFLNPNLPSNQSFFVTTGGSSGFQMKYFQSSNIWWKEVSYLMNCMGKLGFNQKIMKASLRGGEFPNINKGEYWKGNPFYNEIHFSPFHLSKDTIKVYVGKFNKSKIKFIHAYPSAIIRFMNLMRDQNLELKHKLKGVFLISENYTVEQLLELKTYFKCSIGSLYGHSERLIFAPTLKDDLGKMKIDRSYGYSELIDGNSKVINENNIEGELVGTSFDNFSMPLIRYKTGDLTSFSNVNESIINTIKGRWDQEFLIGRNGENVTLTALNFHSDILENVNSYQFYQISNGLVEIFITVNSTYSKQDEIGILDSLNKKVEGVVEFGIKIVESPILTMRGKFLRLIKKLPEGKR